MISHRTLICFTLMVFSISILQTHITIANAVTIGAIRLTTPELKSASSIVQDKVAVGNQVFISTMLENMAENSLQFLAFIEVRDSNGISRQISWVSSVMPGGGFVEISTSWVPDRADAYVLRTFAVTGFENPQVLSIVVERHVGITND